MYERLIFDPICCPGCFRLTWEMHEMNRRMGLRAREILERENRVLVESILGLLDDSDLTATRH